MFGSKLIILALIATTLIVTAKAACLCDNTCGGKHCWNGFVTSCYPSYCPCTENHIYQCNGVRGSAAYDYGVCVRGCCWDSCSLDRCITAMDVGANKTHIENSSSSKRFTNDNKNWC